MVLKKEKSKMHKSKMQKTKMQKSKMHKKIHKLKQRGGEGATQTMPQMMAIPQMIAMAPNSASMPTASPEMHNIMNSMIKTPSLPMKGGFKKTKSRKTHKSRKSSKSKKNIKKL